MFCSVHSLFPVVSSSDKEKPFTISENTKDTSGLELCCGEWLTFWAGGLSLESPSSTGKGQVVGKGQVSENPEDSQRMTVPGMCQVAGDTRTRSEVIVYGT